MSVVTDNLPESLQGLQGGSLFGFRNDGRPLLIVPDIETVEAARAVLEAYQVCTWVGNPSDIDWHEVIAAAAGIEEGSVLVDLWPTNAPDSKSVMAGIATAIAHTGEAKRIRIIAAEDCEAGWSCERAIARGWDAAEVTAWARRDGGKYLRTVPSQPLSARQARKIEKADAKASIHAQWRECGLETDGPGGAPPANEDTVDRLLNHFNVQIWYDTFLQRAMTCWRATDGAARPLADGDIAQLTIWMQRTLKLHRMKLATVRQGVEAFLYSHRRNCAQDWLTSLHWDGVPRLQSLMVAGFGTEQNAYYACVGRNFIMGMVHRVMEPGCQVDDLPVFEGPEDIGKSSALRILAAPWFTECHENIMSKDFLQIMPGHMLMEVAELQSFDRAKVERIKGIISNRVDTYRASYGRLAGSYPRQCVFAGTTNRNDWNTSDTGGRKTRRVKCGAVDLEWLRANREQLLAEATALVTLGEQHYELPRDVARELVDDARIGDPWTPRVLNWLGTMPWTTPEEVLRGAIEMPLERQDKGHVARVRSILRHAGWTGAQRWEGGRNVRVWTAPIVAGR